MALIEESIAARLLAASGVTSLVSARIRPVAKYQDDAVPFVLYQKTATEEIPTHSTVVCEYSKATINIQSYGATQASSLAIARAVRIALHMQQFTSAGVLVAVAIHQDTTDITPPEQAGEEITVFTQSSDFSVLFREV